MTQPGGFPPSDDASHPQSAADYEVGEPGPRAASQETTDLAPDHARFRRKPVVIAIAAVLALVLLGTGVATGLAISGRRTGSAAASSNAGAGGAFRLPATLLGLARNTLVEPTDISPFELILTSPSVSGVYGAAPPHTRSISVIGGTLTPVDWSEARIAPGDMAFGELQFAGSTDPQKFPARATSAGIACAYGTDTPSGTVIVCFSIHQTTVVEAIYAHGAASGLRDAAAKTVQIRLVLER